MLPNSNTSISPFSIDIAWTQTCLFSQVKWAKKSSLAMCIMLNMIREHRVLSCRRRRLSEPSYTAIQLLIIRCCFLRKASIDIHRYFFLILLTYFIDYPFVLSKCFLRALQNFKFIPFHVYQKLSANTNIPWKIIWRRNLNFIYPFFKAIISIREKWGCSCKRMRNIYLSLEMAIANGYIEHFYVSKSINLNIIFENCVCFSIGLPP